MDKLTRFPNLEGFLRSIGRSCGFAEEGWTWRDEAVGAISKIFWCKRKCSLTISRVCTWQVTKEGILVCTRLAIHFSFHRPMCQLKRPSFPLNEVKTRRHFLCFPCRSCRSDPSHANVRRPDSLVWRQETLLDTVQVTSFSSFYSCVTPLDNQRDRTKVT